MTLALANDTPTAMGSFPRTRGPLDYQALVRWFPLGTIKRETLHERTEGQEIPYRMVVAGAYSCR